jgi:hypothetical protein
VSGVNVKYNFTLQQQLKKKILLQHLKDAIRKHTTVDSESQVREVLLKDKFLTVSPNIHKILRLWLQGKAIEPSNTASHVCIYSYVCMSRTLLTGKKKIRDTTASLLLSERAPPDWGLYPELATMVGRRGTSAENA